MGYCAGAVIETRNGVRAVLAAPEGRGWRAKLADGTPLHIDPADIARRVRHGAAEAVRLTNSSVSRVLNRHADLLRGRVSLEQVRFAGGGAGVFFIGAPARAGVEELRKVLVRRGYRAVHTDAGPGPGRERLAWISLDGTRL